MQYHFVKSEPNKLFFKYHYSAPNFLYTTIYKKVNTRNTAVTKRAKLYEKPKGIDSSKKEALLKLCQEDLIPSSSHQFFEELIVAETKKASNKKTKAKKKKEEGSEEEDEEDKEESESDLVAIEEESATDDDES